ncbi:MAG: 2Fe-2S iron-sulfur cluster-binding protein, partial [Bacillota bacterium]
MALITINNKEYQVEDGISILEAAKAQGMEIPTLCYHPELSISGGCRLCLVEDLETKQLIPSCSTEVNDGMKIDIDNERVERARKSVVDLLLSDHPLDCMTCEADGNCTLQDLAYKYDIQESSFGAKKDSRFEIENNNPFIVHDPDKCILCGRCIRVDNEVQCSDAIDFINRGFTTRIAAALEKDLGDDDSSCVF